MEHEDMEHGEPIEMEWECIVWVRWPKSPHPSRRHYWYPKAGTGAYGKGTELLHREVWKRANGRSIPRGYVIHHRDHSPLNNDPANLQCMSREAHYEIHRGPMPLDEHIYICVWCGEEFAAIRRMRFCSKKCTLAGNRAALRRKAERLAERIVRQRDAQAREAQRQVERQQRDEERQERRAASGRRLVDFTCEQCGKTFPSRPDKAARFCGMVCMAKWREANAPAIERTCEQCGKVWLCRAHNRNTRFCSKRCCDAFNNAAGTRHEDRVCAYCAATFRVARTSPIRCCSPRCGQRMKRGIPVGA